MTRAVLPNPSAWAEWLLAGIVDRALHHWGHVLPLDGGFVDHDHADSETDTAIPDDDVDIASFPSQPSASLRPSSFELLASAFTEQFASALAMMCQGDFVLGVPPGDLQLDALFEDHGVFWLAIDEMFPLEWATKRRCFPAKLPLSALQRYNRRKCAHLLRDFAASAGLPPRSALFRLELLDLTGGPKGKTMTSTFSMSSLWLPQSTSCLR